MILPDINLLLYAHIDGFREHRAARKWWNDAMNAEVPVGLAEAVLFGFVRVATNPRAFRIPVAVESAVACVEGWLNHPERKSE